MDLVEALSKKVKSGDEITPERKAELALKLTHLSKDGADTAFKLIKSYKDNHDSAHVIGNSNLPYYGVEIPTKNDEDIMDVSFNINDLPKKLLLILEVFVQEI